MTYPRHALLMMLLLLGFIGIQACSSEGFKRTTHRTLENMQYRDCQRKLRDDCKKESYEEYQRKREESTQQD